MVTVLPLRVTDWTDDKFRNQLLEVTDCVPGCYGVHRAPAVVFAWMAENGVALKVTFKIS